jgi:uncharacterized spore protein YtfJ
MSGENASNVSIDDLFQALSDASIMADPIRLQDRIVIPASRIDMTLGGSLDRTDRDGAGRCGAGGTAGIFPVAVLAIDKEISGRQGVKVISISPPGDHIADVLPSFMDLLGVQKEKRE